MEHQGDCSGDEGQEGAEVEAVKALVLGGWKPTHLGSFTTPGWGWGVSRDIGSLDPSSPAVTGVGAGESPPQIVIVPSPAQAQVPLQPQQLILVTLGPVAGEGPPGSWPQLAGEPGLHSVIRRKPEPGHKL